MTTALFAWWILCFGWRVTRDKTGSSIEASYRKFEQRYQIIGLKAEDKKF